MFFRAITTERVPNVTGHHLFDVFVPSYFLITKMHVATEVFSVMYSCCCLTGLGLRLNILVLFPSLIITAIFQFTISFPENFLDRERGIFINNINR